MYVPFGHPCCFEFDPCLFILIAGERKWWVPEWEQNRLSAESKLVVRATHQHQIVLFFFRILCVGQDVNDPAKLRA
jgi:hypothetical protein